MKQHVLYLTIYIVPMWLRIYFSNSGIVAILHFISPIARIHLNINMHATYLDQIYPKSKMFAFASL